MTPDEIRQTLILTLERLSSVVPAHSDAWTRDEIRQWAAERLWITAGTAAELYRRVTGLPRGAEPWRELYIFRNVLAHALPQRTTPERVWRESRAALPWLIAAVAMSGEAAD